MRYIRGKDEMIQIRVARAQKQRLVEAARHRGVSLSKFVRETATAAISDAAA